MQWSEISIHAPPRGATVSLCTASRSPAISIHAPPRGATTLAFLFGDFVNISIHAPPRGATRRRRTLCKPDKQFQFTPLREGRPNPIAIFDFFREISIHAPPRGATLIPPKSQRQCKISIHAPPRGATYILILSLCIKLFQFTPLREGRLQYYQRYLFQKLFQFTPLREGRQ